MIFYSNSLSQSPIELNIFESITKTKKLTPDCYQLMMRMLLIDMLLCTCTATATWLSICFCFFLAHLCLTTLGHNLKKTCLIIGLRLDLSSFLDTKEDQLIETVWFILFCQKKRTSWNLIETAITKAAHSLASSLTTTYQKRSTIRWLREREREKQKAKWV